MFKAIMNFIKKVSADHAPAYAGQAALFFIMSLIPFLLLLISAVRLTPITQDNLIYWIELFAPEAIQALLRKIVREVYLASTQVLLFSLGLAIFSAAKTIHSLQYSLNIVYGIKETRNWFVLRFWAIIETLLLIVAMLLLMGVMIFGRQIQNLLCDNFPMIAKVTRTIFGMRTWILFFVLIVVLTWIYKVLPNRKATFKSQLIGGSCCSALWYLFSFFVSVYNHTFHGFSLYGSLTTIMLIMFWLYYGFFIFLVCGEINSQFENLWQSFLKDIERSEEEEEESPTATSE